MSHMANYTERAVDLKKRFDSLRQRVERLQRVADR